MAGKRPTPIPRTPIRNGETAGHPGGLLAAAAEAPAAGDTIAAVHRHGRPATRHRGAGKDRVGAVYSKSHAHPRPGSPADRGFHRPRSSRHDREPGWRLRLLAYPEGDFQSRHGAEHQPKFQNRRSAKLGRKPFFDPAIFKERFNTIERVFGWEDKFRHLLLRFERLSALHYAFKSLAYAMINLRHFC